MRWTRAIACKSGWGFQSESKRLKDGEQGNGWVHWTEKTKQYQISSHSHARISCLQIDTQSPTASRHEEDEISAARCVKLVNNVIPLSPRRSSVKTAIFPSSQDAIILKDIEHRSELRENTSTMSLFEERHEDLVEHGQFTRRCDEFFHGSFSHVWFRKIWVEASGTKSCSVVHSMNNNTKIQHTIPSYQINTDEGKPSSTAWSSYEASSPSPPRH